MCGHTRKDGIQNEWIQRDNGMEWRKDDIKSVKVVWTRI